LPFQLTSSLQSLHTLFVNIVLVCFFPFSALCLLCTEAVVHALFSPLATARSYCVFFTRTTEMVALRQTCHFTSSCFSYLAVNTVTL
jgi:hypothetical protein